MPNHWLVIKQKFIFSILSGFAFKSEYFRKEAGYLPILVTPGSFHQNGGLYFDQKNTHSYAGEFQNIYSLAVGDQVIVMTDLSYKKLILGNCEFVETQNLLLNQRVGKVVLEDSRRGTVNKKYLRYAINAQHTRKQVCLTSTGATVFHSSPEKIGNIFSLLPSLLEQEIIASFLDHETAKIDTLIEEQQSLIRLLKEKRQAVISHAVTKGLNPDAPMKDSGVEWLGDVPEHWVVSKFGYISLIVRGGSPRPAGDPALFNGDYSPWVTVAEITKDDEIYLTATETCLTQKGSEQCQVFRSGTLLLSNSGATLGVPKILSIDANANDGVVGFERLSLNHEFSYFYLSTLTEDIRERVKQGSGQPNLNTDIVKDIAVPVPPKHEVDEIVSEIGNIRKQYSMLMEQAGEGIKLLQERHTGLISAAVTGKIDVRHWQPTAHSQQKQTEAML